MKQFVNTAFMVYQIKFIREKRKKEVFKHIKLNIVKMTGFLPGLFLCK